MIWLTFGSEIEMEFPFKVILHNYANSLTNWQSNWKTSKICTPIVWKWVRRWVTAELFQSRQLVKYAIIQRHTAATHTCTHLFMQPTQYNAGVEGNVMTRHTELVTLRMPINAQTGRQLCSVGYIYRLVVSVHTSDGDTQRRGIHLQVWNQDQLQKNKK